MTETTGPKTEKLYVWNGKKVENQNILNFSIKKEALSQLYFTEKGTAFISVMKRSEPDQYWNTRFICQDDYVVQKLKDKANGGGTTTGDDLENDSVSTPKKDDLFA